MDSISKIWLGLAAVATLVTLALMAAQGPALVVLASVQ